KPRVIDKPRKDPGVPSRTVDQARIYFEQRRWPGGPVCVHCGSANCYRLGGASTRAGLLECRDCRRQFTVTVHTIMADSHLSLAVWAKALYFMTRGIKKMSALQLQRNLKLGSYRTAWVLAHRIRQAMRYDPATGAFREDPPLAPLSVDQVVDAVFRIR